ncbi:hypothetical protein H8S17_02415 [Roseburia sp. BX1005]|jgi:hypothetical protein|uniref:Uncharacterized protein n=1 Tax=Roseburia zhanii TaxID=2763064 RepID=A0A923LN87_9FIRM|nr:hypothetical protein [Roseburia zhanii]MBC5713074.1 hypothetical protein [Roseburia zhanii]OLA91895.1 MAG: hypothetical protein BHW44_04430 [Roseburia sp. 40_7]
MEQKIDKEVFDTFFRENYVPVDYATVREEFYEITADKEEVFSEELEDKPLTEKNFILYMRSDIYCQLEGCVEDAFEMLNPEITDAVMDISMSMEREDEITAVYWKTLEDLLKQFLKQLYAEKFAC